MKIVSKTIFLLIFFLSSSAFSSVDEFRDQMNFLTQGLNEDAGIKIVSLERKDELYSKNDAKLLNPASTTKLVTAATALTVLRPEFRFHTAFYISPENDLYILGSGDPSIVVEDIEIIADRLADKGVKYISNILVNDNYFDGYTHPGLPPEKSRFNSYLGALSINFNRIQINVKPSSKIGNPATVQALSGTLPILIKNNVKTTGKKKGSRVTIVAPTPDDESDLFVVQGYIPISSKGVGGEHSISLPPFYFAHTLRAMLEKKGVETRGKIRVGHKPHNSKLLIDYESKPLSEIVSDMNKFSNNFISEQLVKVLGAENVGVPGSTAKGVQVLGGYMNSIGFARGKFVLVNGSGLTYENRMTAKQLVQIMEDMYANKKLWPYFRDSLSVWGKDGTLRQRKDSALLRERAYAKTGSLNLVKTIAGVVPSSDGEMIAFAILLNGGSNTKTARKLQTDIVEQIASFKR